ncbi:hypothetical protein SYNPS1DRAFT_28286 [Syncephalis pseudoplumigaleata]|uniref:NELF-A N-terminal domain-containing protein n=1 Tax=Syncephalis pseudoplumigaleata TaxID=1712513 RepID=A0A4P9Z3B9_9FUNG|nr:hypothetical protein SYNPS1DRAFT_28286 [Syncephalis pseudoplumigaleata]|eukprot:RKP26000.1 hypothetical protein SYNPS1DRAFT_28286 [Syncephalis pseudoplumigaleata]
MDGHTTDLAAQSDTVQQLLRSAVSAPTWVSALTLASHLTEELVGQLQTDWPTFEPAARIIVCLSIACIRPVQLKELSGSLAQLVDMAIKDPDDWVSTLAQLFRRVPTTGRIDLDDIDHIAILSDRIDLLALQLQKGVSFTRDEEAYLNQSAATASASHRAALATAASSSAAASMPLATIRSSEGVTTRAERQTRFQALTATPVSVTAVASGSSGHHQNSPTPSSEPYAGRPRASMAMGSGGGSTAGTTSTSASSAGLFMPRRAPPAASRPAAPKQIPSFLRTGVQRPRPINTSTRVTTTGGSITSASAGTGGNHPGQPSAASESASAQLASPIVPVTPGGRETRMQMLDIAEGAAIIRSVEDEKTRKLQDEAREKELRMQRRRQEIEQRRMQEAEEKRRRMQERNDKRERKRQKSMHTLREREAEERAMEVRLQEQEAERQRELALDSQMPVASPVVSASDSAVSESITVEASPPPPPPAPTSAAVAPTAIVTMAAASKPTTGKCEPKDNASPPSSVKRARYDAGSNVAATTSSPLLPPASASTHGEAALPSDADASVEVKHMAAHPESHANDAHAMAHPTSTPPPPPPHPVHHAHQHHAMMSPGHPHATPPAHNYHYPHPPGPAPAPASMPATAHAGYPPPPHPPPSNVNAASTQSKELLAWIDQNANCLRPDERHYIEAFVMGDRSVPLPQDATVPIYQVVLREERQQDPHTGAIFQVRVMLEMAIDTMRWRQLQMRTPCP